VRCQQAAQRLQVVLGDQGQGASRGRAEATQEGANLWVLEEFLESTTDPYYAGEVDFSSLPLEHRLDMLKDLLTQEGFFIVWERDAESYYVHEISCPYFRISEQHPEVCTIDETLISNLLMVPTQRVSCVLKGDAHCTYEIVVGPEDEAEQTL